MAEKSFNENGEEVAVKDNYDWDPDPPMWSYPHGKQLSIVTTAVTTAAVLFGIASTYVCTFVKRKIDATYLLDSTEVSLESTKYYGIWFYQGSFQDLNSNDDSSCYRYPSEFDPSTELEVAQAFSIVSSILGFGSVIFSLSLACNIWSAGYRRACALAMIIALISRGLTFIIFSSDTCNDELLSNDFAFTTFSSTCSLSTGGILAIVSMCHYMVATGLICKIPDGQMPE